MIKSIIFYILLFIWTILLGITFVPLLLLPKERLYQPIYFWIRGIFLILRIVCGVAFTIKGKDYIKTNNAKIIASKHQSAFETLLLFYLIPKAMFIHKYELFFIPIFGLFLKKLNMVSINRLGGPKELKKMLESSKTKIENGHTLIIFPEGTRKKPGDVADYKPGVAGIYNNLDTNVIPVALNSGLFWPKNSFNIKPGKIIIEFLPPINKGLSKETFLKTLEKVIEDKVSNLIP